jgi:hypothetical protein
MFIRARRIDRAWVDRLQPIIKPLLRVRRCNAQLKRGRRPGHGPKGRGSWVIPLSAIANLSWLGHGRRERG